MNGNFGSEPTNPVDALTSSQLHRFGLEVTLNLGAPQSAEVIAGGRQSQLAARNDRRKRGYVNISPQVDVDASMGRQERFTDREQLQAMAWHLPSE